MEISIKELIIEALEEEISYDFIKNVVADCISSRMRDIKDMLPYAISDKVDEAVEEAISDFVDSIE